MLVFKSGITNHCNAGVICLDASSEQRLDGCALSAMPSVVSIEALMQWVYGSQKVDGIHWGQSDLALTGFSGGLDALERIERLGVRVDGGGSNGDDRDPDALAVHDVVCAYAAKSLAHAERAGLVVLYARAGCRPDVPSADPSIRCIDRRTFSYWAGKEELDFIPTSVMRKPIGYDGSCLRKGQACDVMFARDYDAHTNRLKLWEDWAVALEELQALLPVLRRWTLKPYSPPAFVRAEGRGEGSLPDSALV